MPSSTTASSPFEGIPPLPAAAHPGVGAPLLLTTLATVLTAAGPAGLRRRDLGQGPTYPPVPEGPFGRTLWTYRPLTAVPTAR